MGTKLVSLTVLLIVGVGSVARGGQPPPGSDDRDAISQRAKGLLERMTLQEKIDMLAGVGFETKPVTRLGIPPLRMTDGPQGVRWGKATAFPAGACMAATWNPDLIQRAAVAIALDAKAKGRQMVLAPCVNIVRVPMGGRSFESFGEDPYLASVMTVAFVRGVQSEKVIACVKHFAANNQETDRFTVSANVDERTLREIYFPAFKAGIQDGGAWSVMAAYNKLNGLYCTENSWLLDGILKKEWGFQGFVVSDWGATHSTIQAAQAGLDLEMPDGKYFTASLLDAVRQGQVDESVINEKVTRILKAMLWTGMCDEPVMPREEAVSGGQQRTAAREVAREGMVLLKNDANLLPLDLRSVRSIAVLGPNASVAVVGGGGSARVEPTGALSPLEVFVRRAGGSFRVTYARGLFSDEDFMTVESASLRPGNSGIGVLGEYFANPDCKGTPVLVRVDPKIDFTWNQDAPAPTLPNDGFSVRWTGVLVPPADGRYELSVRTDDGVRLALENRLLIDDWHSRGPKTQSVTLTLRGGRPYPLKMEYFDAGGRATARLAWRSDADKPLAEAVQAARDADIAFVFAGLNDELECEGFDRESLELPQAQNDLIEAVLRVNKRTVVILNAGAPVLMTRWLNRVPALLLAWYPGQEGAESLVDLLTGMANPSGKLPVTFPKRWEESPAHGNYPGNAGTVNYKEGVMVGYRGFDAKNLDVAFPFGFGLSYSTFEYRNLRIVPASTASGLAVRVSLQVENTSRRVGAEVVQLYVSDPECSVPRPVKELKGFSKIILRPGQKTDLTFDLPREALSFFNPTTTRWTVEPGKFDILVGSSSRDIRLRGEYRVE